MKKNQIIEDFIALLLIAALMCCSSDSTVEPEDQSQNEVSGTWTLANSPIQLNDNITIPDGETLTIEAGVEVIFNGHYKFIVKGRLLAVGTIQDSIKFTANDENTGWHGIKLLDIYNSNDSTILEYCIFQFGKANTSGDRFGGAINTNLNKLRISHCLFQNNMTHGASRPESAGGAIAIQGNPVIEFCEFKANESTYGGALVIAGNSSDALIRNNHFHNNNGHGTINVVTGASPLIINNLINNNQSDEHGIVHFGSDAGNTILINNTIVNNSCPGGGAVFVHLSLPPLFINNIVYGNESAQVHLESSSNLDFYYCLIEDGVNGFTGANFSGTYQNCMDSDPQFVGVNDFHLQNTSPCLGAAADSIEINGTFYFAPSTDIAGNARPNPVGSNPDIGAYEN